MTNSYSLVSLDVHSSSWGVKAFHASTGENAVPQNCGNKLDLS